LGGALLMARSQLSTADEPHYVTARVRQRDIESSVLATGTLEAALQVSVGAQVSGQIKSLKVALGDTVKKGDLIAEIDSMTQENALLQAKAQLDDVTAQRRSKEATLKQERLAFARQQTLVKADASSREDFETAQANMDSTVADIAALDAQIAEAKVAVDTAKVNLGYTRIVAPIDGTVVYVAVQEGQTVNANQTTPTIIKMATLDMMKVKVEISEADIVKAAPGQKAYFTILGDPQRKYEATLQQIEPAPDSISEDDTTSSSSSSSSSSSASSTTAAVYYNGILMAPNPDGRLRISMTSQVTIILAAAKDALVIPQTALMNQAEDGTATVQVLDDKGKPAERKIKTGISDNADIQVLDGLRVGEQVVTGDSSQTTDGNEARRRRVPMAL
jgi:macrolide-specific efflux system membrane fusion protein